MSLSIPQPLYVGTTATLSWSNPAAARLRITNPSGTSNQKVSSSGSLYYRPVVAGPILFEMLDKSSKVIETLSVNATVKPAPEPEPEPEPEPTPPPTSVVWISAAEVMALPNNNTAFNRIKSVAAGTQPSLSYTAYSENHAKWVMANALVGVRNNDSAIKARAISGLEKAVSTSYGKDSFKEITRNWPEYIISASMLNYRAPAFLAKMDELMLYRFEGSDAGTIMSNNETSPGNGSACAGAMLAAAAIYRPNTTWRDSAIKGIKMFCGLYPGQFDIRHEGSDEGRDLWYYPPGQISLYTPINPPGSIIKGEDCSGFIPVEVERSSPTWQWPPPCTANYHRLDLGSRVIQAEILAKAGIYNAFPLMSNALLRAAQAEIRLVEQEGADPNWAVRTYFHYRILELRHGVSLGSTIPKDGRCVTGVDWTHPKAT